MFLLVYKQKLDISNFPLRWPLQKVPGCGEQQIGYEISDHSVVFSKLGSHSTQRQNLDIMERGKTWGNDLPTGGYS